MTATRVVLIGLRGSGKTTVGRALAAALGWPFADADERLAAAVGRPAGDWLAEVGEATFRRREEEVLLPLLQADDRAVVATGGGAVLIASVRAALRDPRLLPVWLDAPDDVLLARVAAQQIRRPPLTGLEPAAEIAAVRRARAGLYALAARVVVDTGRGSPAAAVAAIRAVLTADPAPPV